jgi:hypothetical protein
MRVMTRALLLVLAACKFEPAKLAAVCDGTGYSRAAEGTTVMATAKRWVRYREWTLDKTQDPEHSSKVLCIDQAAGAFDRDCQMDAMDAKMEIGGDDPKVEVHEHKGPAQVIKAYAARYTLTLRDAKTAKVLAEKTVDAPIEECPLITLGDERVFYADLPDSALETFTRAAPAP